jgi:hypothetical protein
MKKVLCAALLLFSFAFTFGQSNKSTAAKDAKSITFYGVDFSLSKVFGFSNSSTQIKDAFAGINRLFIGQARKFDVPASFKKDDVLYNFDLVNKLNDEMSVSSLFSDRKKYAITSDELRSHIKGYNTTGNGIGLILIAERLDKQDEMGYYYVIFFEESTGEILYKKPVSAKTHGFGLKNHWASSIYKIMKEWRY